METKPPKNLIWIASFDIGKKNFSFCVEVFDKNELENIENIPACDRYNPDGTPTEEMNNILQQVYSCGKIKLHDNVDLTENCDKKKKLDTETYHNMITVLDKYSNIWEKCSIIIIEQQMSFGSKVNLTAIKLAQHCNSYFTIRYGREKTVIEFPAFHKTHILGAKMILGKPYKSGKVRFKTMEQRDRKKWSVEKCIEILTERGENDILEKMKEKVVNPLTGRKRVKKLDDLADVVCQLMAGKYLIYVV
jgi:hypothetical protein